MRLAVLIAALGFAGCQSEPDFDERYEATEKQLREKAHEMDQELVKRGKAATGEGDGPGEAKSTPADND